MRRCEPLRANAVALGLVAMLAAPGSAQEDGQEQAAPQPAPVKEEAKDNDPFDELMAGQTRAGAGSEEQDGEPADAEIDYAGASVRVPLSSFFKLWSALSGTDRRARPRRAATPVVLGEAHYDGRVIRDGDGGALALTVRLGVTLTGQGVWKTVPLIGDDVVLAKAAVDGKPIGVTTSNGYQVWVTRQTGELVIDMEIRIPARGPRGSSEHDFRVVRTPVTSFVCRFPGAGLEPRVDSAVVSSVATSGDETVLEAVLRPTTRIQVVGFHDFGNSRDAVARTYAETLTLLSVDETAVEVFSVIRYTILHAGAREFAIELPDGVEVLSAEGRGAFRYDIEERGGKRVLRGETEFPIRDSYEISLRLSRSLDPGVQTSLAVPLPRAAGVEREIGWLALEAPGKTELEEVSRQGVSAIDTRQLPVELVRSAVSPILSAYRYSDAAARSLVLRATRLPEQETASESIDHVRAFSVVSAEGAVLTEMRLSLRNRVRNSLSLAFPKRARVRSTLLDGQPIKPSRASSGELVLPLHRSRGKGGELEPITLHVVFEDRVGALDSMGRPELALPAVDLPVSSLEWSLFLPASNIYSAPSGDIVRQLYLGQGQWTRQQVAEPAGDEAHSEPTGDREQSAHTGAMPVRIDLPKAGVRLEYERYWLPAGQPAGVTIRYMRRWLAHPFTLIFGLLVIAGARIAAGSARRARPLAAAVRPWRRLWTRLRQHPAVRLSALAGAAVSAYVLADLAGVRMALVFGVIAALIALPHRRIAAAPDMVARWWRTLAERYRADREHAAAENRALAELEAETGAHSSAAARSRSRQIAAAIASAAGKIALAVLLVAATVALAEQALALAGQLIHPLGG